MFKLQWIWGPG